MEFYKLLFIGLMSCAFTVEIAAAVDLNCTITQALDLAIVIDGSESMTSEFDTIKNYLSKVVEMLDINIQNASAGVRVAIWIYTYSPHIQCNYLNCSSKNVTLEVVESMDPPKNSDVKLIEMANFVAYEAHDAKYGARTNESGVEKAALVIFDSPSLPSEASVFEIKKALADRGIFVNIIPILDSGVTMNDITSFIPLHNLNHEITELKGKDELQTTTNARAAFKSRYGCDKCLPNPCKNGATCENYRYAPYYKCNCTAGYQGKNCADPDDCAICEENGGMCVQLVDQKPQCNCLNPSKVGDYCELPNPCFPPPGPCENGASCRVFTKTGLYQCDCIGNFTGKDCDILVIGPCDGNPCNDFKCDALSPTQRVCRCPENYRTPPDCSSCTKELPCKPNPCLNGCACKESPNHEGGFICEGTRGQLGRFCEIPPADVSCKATYIKVRIPEIVVTKFESGLSGVEVFISPIPKNAYGCTATHDSSLKKYVVRIPFPFKRCGTKSNGDSSKFSNTVWLNRVSTVLSIPVPLLQFNCSYDDSHSVVSALKPDFGIAPDILKSGKFKVTMKAYMHPPGEKEREQITSGSMYTIGETVYLTIKVHLPSPNKLSSPLILKAINCVASPVQHIKTLQDISLVKNECPNTHLGIELTSNRTDLTTTIGFRVFRFTNKRIVFYKCQVEVCSAADPACNVPKRCPTTRRRRSVFTSTDNIVQFGPLIILSEEEIVAYEKEKQGHNRAEPTSRLPEDVATDFAVVILAGFTVIVLLTSVIVCAVSNKKEKMFTVIH